MITRMEMLRAIDTIENFVRTTPGTWKEKKAIWIEAYKEHLSSQFVDFLNWFDADTFELDDC